MSYQECLIFVAYLKYLKALNGKQGRQTPSAEHFKAANPKISSPDKPHRTELDRPRGRNPQYTLEELLSQMPEYKEHCEAVKAGKLKPHRKPPPHRSRRKSKFTLEELLARMPDDGGNGEVDTGPPVGNEVC